MRCSAVNLLSLLLIWFLLPACAAGPAAEAPLDASRLSAGSQALTRYFTVLEDPDHTLSFEHIRQSEASFHPSGQTGEALSFGYTRSAYWLKVTLSNPGDIVLPRRLEISNARLSDVTLFRPSPEGGWIAQHTGSAAPYATRGYPNRYYVFDLTLQPKSRQTVYLRIASQGAKLIPARLWEPSAHDAYAHQDYLAQGIYFGMVVAMVLFNLVLFLTIRDRLYLQYVAFVGMAAMALACQNGLAHEWLWPGVGGSWPNLSASLLFSLSAAMLVVFMRRMIGTRALIPRLDKLLSALLAFFLVSPLATVFFYQQTAGPITTVWSIASPLIMLVAIVCALKGQRSAHYFLAAFFVLFIGNMSSSLAALAVLPHNLITNYGSQIGSGCEMMLLAFALADRVHVMRREKEQAQAAALEAQASLIVGLQLSELRLEARVAQRTEELQRANDTLAALSMTDGLTAIANRRRFDQMLASEWTRAARQRTPLAVGLLDIDHFKQYNDHYGHQQGDECLRRVAAAFAGQFKRGGDLVARYGGEEFVFIAPATDADNALSIAHAVCEAVEALHIPHTMAPGGWLTVSVGVAARIPDAGEAVENVVRAADRALYRAKQLGRNRAEID